MLNKNLRRVSSETKVRCRNEIENLLGSALYGTRNARFFPKQGASLMQIRNNALQKRTNRCLSHKSIKQDDQKEKLTGLYKSDVIGDIFNNRQENNEEKRHVKVCISQTSQLLANDLKKDFENFLGKNKEVAKLLKNIQIPENEYTCQAKNSDLSIRKIRSYLRWLQFKEKNKSPENKTYLSIHELNKDEDIKAIFIKNDTKRKDIHANRCKNIPNYYYLVYPETYAFN